MDEKFRAEARRAGAINPIIRVFAPEQRGYTVSPLLDHKHLFYWMDLRTHDVICFSIWGQLSTWSSHPETKIRLRKNYKEVAGHLNSNYSKYVRESFETLKRWAIARGGWIDENLDDLMTPDEEPKTAVDW